MALEPFPGAAVTLTDHLQDEGSQDEWQLIDDSSSSDESDEERLRKMSNHDLKTAPIFMREALALLSSKSKISAQYGVLGKTIGI